MIFENPFNYKQLSLFMASKSIILDGNFNDKEIFTGIGSIVFANENQITFFHNEKYSDYLLNTKAKACFIKKNNIKILPKTCSPIIVDDPYYCYALTTNFLYPREISNNKVNNNSFIDSKASFGKSVQIENNVTLKENTEIGEKCILSHNSVIGPNVKIGSNTIIMSNCVISNTIIGNDCIIQPGVIIGGKGFGFSPESKIEIRHVGNVIIGNNVDIGSNSTIDKASIDSTIIGDNVRIDNLVQIAHNVKIGKNTIIAAQTGIAGSTEVGEGCVMGGQVGIAGHLKIGSNVKIAAKSGVTKNILDNLTIAGFPAKDIRTWRKDIVKQNRKLK